MKRYRGKETRITAVKREYDLVPRLPASRSSNDYSHPLSLLPHIATVIDTSACEQWQESRTVPLCTEHATDHQEVGPFQGLPCGTYASTMATSGTLWRFKDEDTGKYLPNRDELRRATCNLAPG